MLGGRAFFAVDALAVEATYRQSFEDTNSADVAETVGEDADLEP